MSVDRYTKIVLTLIALELGWIAAKGIAVPVSAQSDPAPVVITGIEITSDRAAALPVLLTGTVGAVKITADSALPVAVRQPLKVEADRPIIVETANNPLLVRSVQATPAPRPGE